MFDLKNYRKSYPSTYSFKGFLHKESLDDLYESIDDLLVWANTPQGRYHWSGLYNSQTDIEPEDIQFLYGAYRNHRRTDGYGI